MISFSVIIPNYNHEAFLTERIDSVLSQTYLDFELIILDDCSSDNSRKIIETYRGHHKISYIVYNDKNSGSPFIQWKKGVELAKNEWVWIAESDDFANVRFLEEAAKALQEFPNAGIFYSDSFIFIENDRGSQQRFSAIKNTIFSSLKWNKSYFISGIDEINECLKFDCTINNASSMVFNKKLAAEVLSQSVSFQYYGDWFFILNLAILTNIYYFAKPLNYYRKHADSHLQSETSLLISKSEYFKILKVLYYCPRVTGKKKLLNHFAYHYLGFGLRTDGIKKIWSIIHNYFITDKTLAFKVLIRIANRILFRETRPFFTADQ